MLGYIVPDKPELKIKEYELYGGYYCGICRSIGRRYGQLPRLTLSYDSVLLALLLSAINGVPEHIQLGRCAIQPLKKKNIVSESTELDYAADILLLLAYFKMQDDWQDKRSKKAALGMLSMKPIYHKLKKTFPRTADFVEKALQELRLLEKENCSSLDQAAEPFAQLMSMVFCPDQESQLMENLDEKTKEDYRRMGYHIGKWIYLIDAFDDVEENCKDGAYNPLFASFDYKQETETVRDFRKRAVERVERNLMLYLAEIAKCYEAIEVKKNQGLLENIIYFGLLRKTEEILGKGI